LTPSHHVILGQERVKEKTWFTMVKEKEWRESAFDEE